MKKLYFPLIIVFFLSSAAVRSQSFFDDFDDDSRDSAAWNAPEVDVGNGQLLEQNQRLEFSSTASSESFVIQSIRRNPSYDQPWQAQLEVSMDQVNFTSLNGFGFVLLNVGSTTAGDNHIGVGYAAGVLPGTSGNLEGAFSDAGDGANPNGLLTTDVRDLPQSIGVCAVYDPRLRVIRTYFDLDGDRTDGDWILLRAYTIDGSTIADAQTLDWGMSGSDTFHLNVAGGAEGTSVAVAAGSAWVDNFNFIESQPIDVPSATDDFDDNSRNTAIWMTPMAFAGNGQLQEQNQRLEFSAGASAGPENFVSQSFMTFPRYDEAWQAQLVVSMDKNNFSSFGQSGSVEIEVGNGSSGSGNEFLNLGYGAGVLGAMPEQAIFAAGTDNANPEGIENLDVRVLPDAIGIRVTYDPNLRIIRTYYDLDTDQTDGEWTLFQSFTIDGSSVTGATTLNWGMISTDAFFLGIAGSSYDEGSGTAPAIAAGSAWADDFQFNRGSTATSDAGLFADDFNDDSRTILWDAPFVSSGNPMLVEEDHRLEFRASSGTGEQEIQQMANQTFWPQYSQAFEVKVEAHCLPAAMTTDGQLSGLDLCIANSSGNGDLLISVAAIFSEGSLQQGIAADNSEVANDPGTDLPEGLQFGALPEVVGVRVVWSPDTKVMSCYFDTDGDRTKETWVFFRDYTLDGSSDKGTIDTSQWGMSGGDRFRVGLSGFAEMTVVDPGEAYFDNFSLLNAPLLSGFDLWASAIPDAGMRGASIDASGNGIPNLVQYLYGLAPLATDTDVKLAIRMENGFPRLIHGFDGTVTDYTFNYQEKFALGEPSWSPFAAITTIETFLSNGKTFRKVTLPTDPSNKFFRIEAILEE
ncbi:MAG: hypothetical protein ACI8QF_002815 [Limisphaerales bacterium]|jgi:hypothetical protein